VDNEATARLIERQYGGLLALLRRKLRDEQLAAEILSQAIVVTSEHVKTGRIADAALIPAHIFRLAMNELRSHTRLADPPNRTLSAQALDRLLSRSAWPAVGTEISMQRQVRDIVLRISAAKDREIIRRFYLDEVEKDAICRELALLPLRFDRVVFRVRQRMRDALTRGEPSNQGVSS